MRITRKQAVDFTELQFDQETGLDETGRGEKIGSGAWHYGRQEIQQLLDMIYGYNSKGENLFCSGRDYGQNENSKNKDIETEIKKVEESLDEGEAQEAGEEEVSSKESWRQPYSHD